MSLIFALVLIAIARLLTAVVDGLPHVWHSISCIPGWLVGATLVGLVAWVASDPQGFS